MLEWFLVKIEGFVMKKVVTALISLLLTCCAVIFCACNDEDMPKGATTACRF